ncbi:hypothetical protein [Actinoplanes sp. NPDC051859]|uniref:hypothetical protein n=1 Tax=Actinoplanes sp. NPDC051859 TaxID=3363909 RepID=UPI0037A56B5A
MRVCLTELPIAVRVSTPAGIVVALPRGTSRQEALDLASVILTSAEYEQLRLALGPAPVPGLPRRRRRSLAASAALRARRHRRNRAWADGAPE